MAKPVLRTYSHYTSEAITLLAKLIRTARAERKLTTQEVADRAGISRGLLQRIEKGDPKCEIGAFLEVATIVGITLFDADETSVSRLIRQTDEKLVFLPKAIRKKIKAVDDDF